MKTSVLLSGLLGGLLLASAPAVVSAASSVDNLFPDEVVAKAKDFQVKRSELDDSVTSLRATMAASGRTFPEADRPRLERSLLDRMIFSKLVMAQATPAERAKGMEEADKFVAEFKKKMPSDEVFKRRIEANGMSVQAFHDRAVDEATMKIVVDRVIGTKVAITDDQVKKFYDENLKQFEQPEGVKILVIQQSLIDPATRQPLPDDVRAAKRANIERALVRVKAGEDFAKLVTEFSEDEMSKDRGGQYTIGHGQTPPEFEMAAFGLDPGKFSDIVTTRNGYYIIKQVEKIPAKTLPFPDVQANIREGLQQQEIQKQMPAYYEQLKKDNNVEILLK